jgi:hypothetical protein
MRLTDNFEFEIGFLGGIVCLVFWEWEIRLKLDMALELGKTSILFCFWRQIVAQSVCFEIYKCYQCSSRPLPTSSSLQCPTNCETIHLALMFSPYILSPRLLLLWCASLLQSPWSLNH